jgi:predicted dehydrogenase
MRVASGSGLRPIRVGVVGVEPGRSWSALAHLPALRALPQFEVVAIANSSLDSARRAADAEGVPRAYGGHEGLVADPDVDLVIVTVKAPAHRPVVMDALRGRKPVFCEWPVGRSLGETSELHDCAMALGVRTFVGLQARAAPEIVRARELIRGGALGEILSTTLVGSGMNWGPIMSDHSRYLADPRNGATLTTIPFAHALDTLCHLLGEFQALSAVTAVRRPIVRLESGVELRKPAEDQIAVCGVLASGAVATIHYRGGSSPGVNFLWEINGTEGHLQLTADGGHPQIFKLALRAALGDASRLRRLRPHPPRWAGPPLLPRAVNVALAYCLVAQDLQTGSATAPDFGVAVARRRAVETIRLAAQTG